MVAVVGVFEGEAIPFLAKEEKAGTRWRNSKRVWQSNVAV
jgi:hypothetical protein